MLSDDDDQLLSELSSIARAARASTGDEVELPVFDTAAMVAAVRAEVGLPAPAAVPEVDSGTVLLLPTARPTAPSAPPRRLGWFVAAAAVVLIGAFAAMTLLRSPGTAETVLAVAELDLLGPSGGASAELVEVNGKFEVHVHTEGLSDPAVDAGDGYFEVWLLDADATSLLSLGPALESGEYALSPGFDPATLPVVDVSVEHFDGDPTHSGLSVLRGALDL